jgi:hypothetical protein
LRISEADQAFKAGCSIAFLRVDHALLRVSSPPNPLERPVDIA